MSPRVAYWTSAFEPEMEAIAAEVATLRRRFPASTCWGLSHRHWMLLSRRRGICLHPRLHLLFRAFTRLWEPKFDLNHIFGSLGDWFYLQGARVRPTVLTVAERSRRIERELLERVDRFVAECPSVRQDLLKIGIESDRIRLIYPPVDLTRYSPARPPDGPFTALFASSPDRADWLESRGVHLVLDAAAMRPGMRFRLLWRPWGDSARRVRQWIAERNLQNVELIVGCVRDMPAEYNRAHVVLAPFTDTHRSKPAPNSLTDSLACGRPVVTTPVVGLAGIIREHGAGLVSEPSGAAIAECIDRLQAEWQPYSRRARRLAEQHFSLEKFLGGYERLYAELLPNSRRAWNHRSRRRSSESVGNPSDSLAAV